MNLVFADTAFYVAMLNPRDSLHEKAVSFSATRRAPILTTEFILVETSNFFCLGPNRSAFEDLEKELRSSSIDELIPASSRLFRKGLTLFAARPDKEWSLTDCISFVVMREHGIAEALTADHHFEQAGFVALLK